jgi:hypothetical protein
MSARRVLNRLERDVRTQAPAEPPTPPTNLPEPDGEQLAREVTEAFANELVRYRRLREAQPELLNPADPPDSHEADRLRIMPPEQVTFADIDRLARADPAAAAVQWEAVKAAARDDLDRGWLAARALAYLGGSAWERACFLAVRDRLRRAWRPRTDAEAVLIDQMAQYEMVRQWWVGVWGMRSRDPMTVNHRKVTDYSLTERPQSAAEAAAEAARMVERLQRLFQNTVRLLLSLRRGHATVVFQRSGQVNVGVGQQLNVGSPPEGEGPDGTIPGGTDL